MASPTSPFPTVRHGPRPLTRQAFLEGGAILWVVNQVLSLDPRRLSLSIPGQVPPHTLAQKLLPFGLVLLFLFTGAAWVRTLHHLRSLYRIRTWSTDHGFPPYIFALDRDTSSWLRPPALGILSSLLGLFFLPEHALGPCFWLGCIGLVLSYLLWQPIHQQREWRLLTRNFFYEVHPTPWKPPIVFSEMQYARWLLLHHLHPELFPEPHCISLEDFRKQHHTSRHRSSDPELP